VLIIISYKRNFIGLIKQHFVKVTYRTVYDLSVISLKSQLSELGNFLMVLIVGCGDLGSEVIRLLNLGKHETIGIRVSSKQSPIHIKVIQADVTQPATLNILRNLKPNIILYCVSAKEQTDESYRQHYVEGLKNVMTTQMNNQALSHLFFVSSTRVYGQKTERILDENIPAVSCDFGGERLLEAENALKNMPCKAISMRLSGIYGEGRLSLINMAKDPSRWPLHNSWSNRIHRDDAARFIVFLIEKALKRQKLEDCYIVTDDVPTQQYEVLSWLATKQGVDCSNIKIPPLLGGKRLSNQRMRSTGFQFHYPNYQIGYSHVLQSL